MENTIRINGVKKAVGDYKRANGHGIFSPWYGNLMLDRKTGDVWTDTFYSVGHNEYKKYHDPAIIDLVTYAHERIVTGYNQAAYIVSMDNVFYWATQAIKEYNAKAN